MIELTTMQVEGRNHIIDARNKVYRLCLDLALPLKQATHVATCISSTLEVFIEECQQVTVKFAFIKSLGHYHLQIGLSCQPTTYQRLSYKGCFNGFEWQPDHACIIKQLQIADPEFVPNAAFLQTERERLIQQSGTEMLQEIRRKNAELNKALQDLKTSSNMIQTEKMRALGNMTAGVAHELNNPMMGILNFVQYAIKHTEPDDRRYQPLVDAEREIQRCQEIITNLLTFSRMKAEGEEGFVPSKLSSLCERIVKLHAYKLRSANIKVKQTFPDDEPTIPLKANKMQQVVLNFVTNAIDAMEGSQQRELVLSLDVGLESVQLNITDTGSGIDEETLDKIFEPFFTTKQTGKGTGLGLSVAQSIIEEHSGRLDCHSKVGEGTTFIITLPLGQQEES